MVEQAWLKEGDVVVTEFMMKYFNDLIDYINENNLKDDFHKWQKR